MAESAPVPTPSVDEFARFQQVMAHVLGHPKLREALSVLSEMASGDDNPMTQLLEMGFALPDDAIVRVDAPAVDSPHTYVICIGSEGGHDHCITFTPPSIHF